MRNLMKKISGLCLGSLAFIAVGYTIPAQASTNTLAFKSSSASVTDTTLYATRPTKPVGAPTVKSPGRAGSAGGASTKR